MNLTPTIRHPSRSTMLNDYRFPPLQDDTKETQTFTGFMATHPTDEDKGLTIYYDGMEGGQHRTKEYAQCLMNDGYDIEWNNATRIKSKGETRHEKLNTPKETIQGNTQQGRSVTRVTAERETKGSPNANPSVKKREVEVEG